MTPPPPTSTSVELRSADGTPLVTNGSAADDATVDDRSNLTRAQFLMWVGQQLEPDVPLYNMIHTFRIEGDVDPERLATAWHDVVAASDALRTTVHLEDGIPQQRVADGTNGVVEVVDLTGDADPDATVRAWVDARKIHPIDLTVRCWDSAVLVLDDAAVWYLGLHHVLADGWSFGLAYQAVADRYEAIGGGGPDGAAADRDHGREPEPMAPLPAYADFLDFERASRQSDRGAATREHWASKAAEPTEPTEFYGRARSGRSSRTDRLGVELGVERSDGLRQLAASPDFAAISADLALAAIWGTVLATTIHRTTGRRELRVGMPFLGRPKRAHRQTIGMFIEIGVLTIEIEPDDTFVTLAERIRGQMLESLTHAKPGISSADLNRSYDLLLNNVPMQFGPFAGHPIRSEWVHTGYGDRDHALRLQTSDFDRTGSFRLDLDVNAELFGPAERGWLVDHLDRVLRAIEDDPTQPIGGFDLLAPAERRTLVEEFNDTEAPYPADRSVVDLILDQVTATPDAVAVEDGDQAWTYRELRERAGVVADHLRLRGIGPGDLVAVCARRRAHTVAGILGILETGAAYLPIDPDYPLERRRLMLDDGGPRAVVTAGLDADELAGLELPTEASTNGHPGPADGGPVDLVALLAGVEPGTATGAGDRPGPATTPDGLAYVIYTSGSTGRPKGTELTNRGLVNYLWWARRMYAGDGPRDVALYSSLSFDLTVTSLFVPLISGGRIVVYDRSERGPGLEILDVFADDRVDLVKLTPAHLALLRETTITCDRIRHLIVGGENLRTELAAGIAERFSSGVTIDNEYGPTETVVGCMHHRFDPVADTGPSVPIGRPAANAAIYVLDGNDQPVPPGVVGEIVIGGHGVARGYRNRPELTDERFGSDRFRPGGRWYRSGDLARWSEDGQIEFLGRNDDQVKIRGARIELGEVEAALLADDAIEAVTVGVVQLGGGDRRVIHCSVCGIPSNVPGAEFDDDGVCGDCRAYAIHRDDVARYFGSPDELAGVIDEVRASADGAEHDCLVLVSGGKDSTYMLYQLVRHHGLRPLVFTLDNGYISASALENVRASCADLGVDLHVASTPHMNEIFADSLDRHANVCDGCYKTIYTLSMGLARQRGIGTIITGLSRGQLFETRLADTFAAREFDPDRIDRMVDEARKAYHVIDDAVFRLLDNDVVTDESIFDEIRFVDYYRYVDVGLDEVYRFLDGETVWRRPPDTGRSTNCLINDVGIYVHNRQRGHHNYALPYSWDVRLGHKQRSAAMDELDDEIDVERVRTILTDIGRAELFDELREDKRLVGYYVSAEGRSPGEVRAALAERVPEFLVPSYLVPLPALPLTANGKIDRAALPDPRTATRSSVAYVGPSNDVERRLCDAWLEVLAVDQVGVADNFFDIGGDSVASIQIVAAAERRGLAISARDLFLHPTVGQLAGVVADRGERPGDHGDPVADGTRPFDDDPALAELRARDDLDDAYPLTPTQLGMVFHTLRGEASYFGQGTCELVGLDDSGRLRRAWEIVCARHPALRTELEWGGLDTPVQVVRSQVDLDWEEVDWRDRPLGDGAAELDALLAGQRRAGFDLERARLMSFTLVRAADRDLLVWNSHHSILDGWSAQLVFGEVLEAFRELGPDPRSDAALEPATTTDRPPFADHVDWLERRDREEAIAWWGQRLGDLDTTTALPLAAEAGSAVTDERSTRQRRLSVDDSTRIADFARHHRVTLSTLGTAAWALVLSRFGRSDDVVFGATVSGRESGPNDVDRIIGMLLTTLPIRVEVRPETPVGTWLDGLQRDSIEARERGHLALNQLQELSALPAGQPLFDSIVVIENYPTSTDVAGPGVEISELQIQAPSNYALALLVHPGDQVRLELLNDPTRIDDESAERLVGYVERALLAIVESAERAVGELRLLDRAETAELLAWSTGPVPTTPRRLLPRWIAQQVTDRPDAAAVVDDDHTITYGELGRRADALAARLAGLAVGRGDHVGVDIAGPGVASVTAVLAIHRLGAVYVPVDRELPATRLATMVAQTSMAVLLTAEATVAGAEETTLVDPTVAPDAPTVPPPTVEIGPDDPAYVIYTSGSTGVPKAVVVTHGNLAASTAARFDVYGAPVESFLLLSSLAFDSSMVGLFWTLASGGTLVAPGAEARRSLPAIAAAIEANGVTHLLALPSVHRALLDEQSPERMGSLRVVIVAGEACPPDLPARHRAALGAVELYNEYGPTEGTVWSHVHWFGPDDEGAPIGGPIPWVTGLVLDAADRPVPVGVPGELVLDGPGIAAGYLGQPEQTDAVFVPPPAWYARAVDGADGRRLYRTGDLVRWRPDGLLDFVGRIDEQVKVRGHRIELGEVELAIGRLAGVTAAAAVVVTDAGGRQRLVGCYLAPDPIDDAEARDRLAADLPRAMVPNSLVHLPAFPSTTTGKVDRRALAAAAARSTATADRVAATPTDRLEEALIEIWTDVLGQGDISTDDDFFDLGGDSLDAMRLFSRIRRLTGRDLLLSSLFEAPTIGQFADLLRREESTTLDSSLVPIKPSGFKRPFYYVAPYEVSVLELDKIGRYFDPDRPMYGLQPAGLLPGEPYHDSIPDIAAHYLDAIVEHQPTGPYLIGGHCDGAWIAHEMATQLADRGQSVDYLGFVDIPPTRNTSEERRQVRQVRRLADRIDYYRRDGRLFNAIAWKVRQRIDKEFLLRFGSAASRRVREVRLAHERAYAAYDFRHDDRTPVHLIRSSEMNTLMDEMAWYAPFRDRSNVRVDDIESTHARLLLEPETQEVARALGEGLDAVDGD